MIFLLLLGCPTERACTSATRAAAPTLAITTADPLFQVGSFAVGDDAGLDTPLFETSADAILRQVDGRLYVVERSSTNAVAAFDPLDGRCPIWQVALPNGANAHDLVGIGDRLYLPLFDGGAIAVLDASTGELLPSIEVPGDTPALDQAVVVGDRLWVADQRFDRADFSASAGVLLEIDPTVGVLRELPAGVNPRISPGRVPGEILVASGLFALQPEDSIRRRDGDLRALELSTGLWSDPLVTEADLDGDLNSVVAVGSSVVATVIDAASHSRVHCVGVGDGPTDPAWFVASAIRGSEVVVAARASLAGPDVLSDRGLFVLDPVSCSETLRIPTGAFDPYDVVAW